jgi:hypothetical protein
MVKYLLLTWLLVTPLANAQPLCFTDNSGVTSCYQNQTPNPNNYFNPAEAFNRGYQATEQVNQAQLRNQMIQRAQAACDQGNQRACSV